MPLIIIIQTQTMSHRLLLREPRPSHSGFSQRSLTGRCASFADSSKDSHHLKQKPERTFVFPASDALKDQLKVHGKERGVAASSKRPSLNPGPFVNSYLPTDGIGNLSESQKIFCPELLQDCRGGLTCDYQSREAGVSS